MALTGKLLRRFLRFYPPYLGAGIKVESMSFDWKETVVSMKARWYNRNAVGTHFGGSLYAMTDPHYMLMLMNILGREYIVWDKAASINFIKATKNKVTATFIITDEIINKIKQETANGDKYLPEFVVDVVDKNEVIAQVSKTLYIKRKKS